MNHYKFFEIFKKLLTVQCAASKSSQQPTNCSRISYPTKWKNIYPCRRSMKNVKNSNPNLKRMIVRCFFFLKKFFLRFILLQEISFQNFDYWIISKLDDLSENFKVTFTKIKCSEYLLCDKSWGIFVCGPLNVFLGVSLNLYSAIIFCQ